MFKIMKGGEMSLESVVSETLRTLQCDQKESCGSEKGHNPAAPAAVRVRVTWGPVRFIDPSLSAFLFRAKSLPPSWTLGTVSSTYPVSRSLESSGRDGHASWNETVNIK